MNVQNAQMMDGGCMVIIVHKKIVIMKLKIYLKKMKMELINVFHNVMNSLLKQL